MGSLVIRKLADRSGDCLEDGSWPLAGISIVDPPQEVSIPQDYVMAARDQGWASVEDMNVVYRSSAPLDDPTAQAPHIFVHATAIVFRTVDGDVRYRVVHQPDKYASDGDDDTPVTDGIYSAGNTRVDHFYRLELEG